MKKQKIAKSIFLIILFAFLFSGVSAQSENIQIMSVGCDSLLVYDQFPIHNDPGHVLLYILDETGYITQVILPHTTLGQSAFLYEGVYNNHQGLVVIEGYVVYDQIYYLPIQNLPFFLPNCSRIPYIGRYDYP